MGLRANKTLSADTPVPSDIELPGYRVEELIGHGGMGVVYLAFDLRLKRRVALKLMTPDLAIDERFRERFARESELVMSLEHPNVVPIHDAGELDGQLYLAMRYVEGTDLRALLRAEGALAPTRAVSIVRQVAHALDAAHARGLVHRDVKPSNVLLDQGEHVYLADFGLTRRVTDDGARLGDARSVGTPAYLAPEQIEGRPVDGRSDVYSLGCLLYECLTGEPPFVGPSRLAVAWAHLEEDPPSVSARNRRLPQALDAVIQKAMAKEPDERYGTCGELVAAAEAALGIDRPRRRALLAVMAAAVAIAAVAIAAFAVTAISSPTDDATGAAPPPDPERLVRIDPATNRVSAEIDVGGAPTATAVSGQTVWVYNRLDKTVSEVDAAANGVRHTTKVSTEPAVLAYGTGPVLAADAAGAWLVGYDFRRDRHLLTRVPVGGGGAKEYRLGMEPVAVVVGDGAVWVLAHRGKRNAALRIDAASGRVLASLRLPNDLLASRVDGLAVGNGYVWVTNLNTARLYRVDPKTGDTLEQDFGSYATRPAVGYGWLWMCIARTTNPAMSRVDPRTLRNTLESGALPAEEGQYAVGHGSVWRHDVPSGTLMRFDPRTIKLTGLVRLMPKGGGDDAHLYVTSIATGAGAVWVTLSQS